MIAFLLGWCALSLVGTLIALHLIRTGKQRQPEADLIPARPVAVATPVPQKH